MKLNGQLHAPTDVPSGEEAAVSIEQEAGWASEPVWTLWRE
jgi:hypothetical protein